MINVSFGNLDGSVVGREARRGIGVAITLDTNAAGYGWFVDSTPGDNTEFLPTVHPNTWIAKVGSPAYGKMDLYSVLLHEYGHALGLSHSPDSHDFMAATLKPGVRHVLSWSDIAKLDKMAGLPAPQPGLPLPGIPFDLSLMAFALRRKGESGDGATSAWSSGSAGSLAPHYDVVVNPTLTNSDFNGTTGWTTEGDVTMGHGKAVLGESTDSQTRMNQVFTVGPQDKFLRFTVDDAALGNPGNVPEDAFEVALLDANTGASLIDPINLSHADAFLNLQGDGSAFVSDAVRVIANADGSHTYIVDLSNIPAGTAVNLSFDLLGFGKASSQVTVRDLHIGVPETFADTVKTAEDTPLTIHERANDVAAKQPGFVPVVVDGPAHGKVTVNADGTFAYTPDANYNGPDHFTYKLSDGEISSNVSAVNITVTPVNDAPVAGNLTPTTLEDTPDVINLLSNAHDIDSPTLTPRIIQGPSHGKLAINADGTYTYTPEANYNGPDSFTYVVNDGELDSNVATVKIGVTSVNDAPEGADNTVTTKEDTPYVFKTSDFGFSDYSDTPADAFAAIIVGQLPTVGSLSLGGQVVTAGERITAADIAAGKLQFLAAPNANGKAYASFTFQVQDDGGTAIGGVDTDPSANTLTVDVTPVNDAPAGADTTVTTKEDTAYVFRASDFGFSDPSDTPADAFAAIIVGQLPTAGSLTLASQAVTAGERITEAAIAAGKLQFLAAPNANGKAYASFTFQVQDDGGTANGGVDTDPTANKLTVNVTPVNDAPAGADTTVTTKEDTPYVFKTSDFGFSDPSDTPSDAFAAIIVDKLPPAGSLTLDGQAVTAGEHITVAAIAAGKLKFLAAPNANGKAYASFTFQVQDDGGTDNGGVDTDPTANKLTVNVTPVNDAPAGADTAVTTKEDTPYVFKTSDFGFSDPSDTPSDAFAAIIVDKLPPAGSLTLDGQAVTAGEHITVAAIAAGKLKFLAAPNANGKAYASFTFQVQDDGGTDNGGVDTDPTANQLTVNVTPVNDPPVAAATHVTGVEDTPYVFTWSDFPVSDIDSTQLSVVLATLPMHGTLQVYDGTDWIAATVGQTLTSATITASHLRFVPAANAAGGPGFGGDAVGNRQAHYAEFTYRANDGELSSDPARVVVDISPVADAPTLTLTHRPGGTRQVFRTDWEDVADWNGSSTLVHGRHLDGWTLVCHPDPTWGGWNGFEVWSDGDYMDGPWGWPHKVQSAADGGHNWLELNDARGLGHQTLGIQRTVDTVAGATYTLNFDYAGRIGYDSAYTAIGIYVDGKEIGHYAGTSPNKALDWKALSFSFVGTGGKQTLKIVTTATRHAPGGRGAMLDNLVLTQSLSANTGLEDTAIGLSRIKAALTDTDGSEVLDLALKDVPAGATLSDGTHTFTASKDATTADITGWNLNALTLTPPTNFNGSIQLTVAATSTETANGDTAQTTAPLTVTVLPVDDAPVANAGNVSVREDKTIVIDVLANDTDVDSSQLSADIVCGPRHGWLTRNADGTYSYTAYCGYVGSDTFTYRASDGDLESAPTTVTIDVTADQRPVANDDTATTKEDTPVTLDMLANDTDADGDTLSAWIVCGPDHGRLCRNADGTWSYLADSNWSGTDTFTYRAWDGLEGSHLAKVTITVTPVNDAPLARNAHFHLREDGQQGIDFTCLTGDVDGDALSLTFAQPAHGTLTRTDDGGYLYQPDKDFTGTDTFTYTVSDGQLSTTATITLSVKKPWGGCGWGFGWHSDSVQVTSGWSSGYHHDNHDRHIVRHQDGQSHRQSHRGRTDSPTHHESRVDWEAKAPSRTYNPGANLQQWHASENGQHTPDMLAKLCGLFVRKPH